MAIILRQTNVHRAWIVCVGALLAGPNVAMAKQAPLPKLYCNVVGHDKDRSFSPVFSIRPKEVVVGSVDGGLLVLHWSSWTPSAARGAGTAHPDHGSFPITVLASDPRHGRFTHLTITSDSNGKSEVDHLHLTHIVGNAIGWERTR